MSTLEFDSAVHTLRLLASGGSPLAGPFVAYNNVDSHSKGPWPAGDFRFVARNAHLELSDPDSEYGSNGILIFEVPGRVGMGVHSGRRDIPDGLGRTGPEHCTLGCIRTTDEAVEAIITGMGSDALVGITVRAGSEMDIPIVAPDAIVRKGVARRSRARKSAKARQGAPKKKKGGLRSGRSSRKR
jgi:hypothetical protein